MGGKPGIPPSDGVPHLPPGHLRRPRLDAQWQSWRDRRLVLVCAGAGFGKTTFLASNARRDPRTCVWFSLAGAQREPGDVYAWLCGEASVEGATRGRALKHLLGVLRTGDVILVIDDLEVAAGQTKVVSLLDALARAVPHGSTLVLSSREPVGIGVARLRTQGAVAALGSGDLQFTEEETEALLRSRFPGGKVDRSLAKRLLAKTEGWAAGMEILLQAPQGASLLALHESLDHGAGACEAWIEYFAEEVIERIDPRLKEFVIQASLVPYLEPDLCDRALGVKDSRSMLETLHRKNLFTFQGPDGASFRFHPLFREVLRERLARELAPAALRSLHLRVARSLARAHRWTEAAAAFAEAGESEAAVEALERSGPRLLAAGQYRAVERALKSIPRARLARRASLRALHGKLLDFEGRWEDAKREFDGALRASRSSSNRDELLSSLALTLVRQGEYSSAIALCTRALRRRPKSLPRSRALLMGLRGLTAAHRGDLREAERHLRASAALSRRSGDLAAEGRALFVLAANVYPWRGQFRQARESARQSILLGQRSGDQRAVCHATAVLAFVALQENQCATAQDLAERSLAQAEDLRCRLLEGLTLCLLGRCALRAGDSDKAWERFEAAARIDRELQEPFLAIYLRSGFAEAFLGQGNLTRARADAMAAARLSRAFRDRGEQARCQVLLGKIEESRRPATADAWWRKARSIFHEMGATFEVHRLLLYRLALGRMPERERRRAMTDLLAGVSDHGHEILILELEPDRAARVLPEALSLGIQVEFAASLIQRLGSRCLPDLARLAERGPAGVRERAVRLIADAGGSGSQTVLARLAGSTTRAGRIAMRALKKLDREPGEPLRIRSLGTFSIACGDLDLTGLVLRSDQSSRLLRFLLVRRFEWVARDEILEAFWPGVPPSSSENRLRQCVHVLRRAMEPRTEGGRQRHVCFRNGAYRLDPGTGYFYDVEEFERGLDEGVRLCDAGKRNGEAALKAALDLYRGAFLHEHPYEDFSANERERLRERYVSGLSRLLDFLCSRSRWEECVPLAIRGLAEEPFHEDLHWHLAHAQLRLSRPREALATCRRYEEIMASELSLAPSGRMKALAAEASSPGRGSPTRSRPRRPS